MDLDFSRDHAMYVVIFGVFGISWFGWAQEDPPKSWRVKLGIAAGISFIIACIGGYMAYKNWNSASVFNMPSISRQFGIIVGIEFALASIGAGMLHLLHKPKFVAAWIALIVGLHFIPLAIIFQYSPLIVLGILVVLAPIVSTVMAKRTKVSVVTLASASTGSLLLVFAIRELVLAIS